MLEAGVARRSRLFFLPFVKSHPINKGRWEYPSVAWVVCSLGVSAVGASVANAQAVFTPIAKPVTDRSAATFFSTNGLAAQSALNASEPDPERDNPLRWGPVAAHPRIDYQYINASGIRQGVKTNGLPRTISTIQHVINPGVNLQVGRHWNVDAGISMNYYTDKAMQDSLGYNVGINGSIPREDWVFGASAGFNSSETSQIETAEQTKQDDFGLGLSGVYGGQRRMTLELGINQDISLSDGFNDSYSWTTMNWLNYVVTPTTTAGLGVGGGYTMLSAGDQSFATSGTDSVNEQLQGRIVWRPADKLSVSLSGGAQFQQFLTDDGTESVVNPIGSISAGYSPVDGTSFSLSGSRTVGTSITSDEYTETVSLSFGFQQRLLKRLFLRITPSYDFTEYRSNTDPTGPSNRSDEILSVHVSLSTVLFKKVNVSTFYTFTDNQSDDEFYAYESGQFGFQVGYRF